MADTLFPMAELAARWGVTSNTVSRRLSYLGIKPIRQGNFRFITADELELAEQLQQHVLSGKPMEAFPRPDSDAVAMTRQRPKDASHDQSQLVAIAAAVAAQLAPAPDPLRRAKALAEAADNGLVLASDELVALGVKGVEGFADGDLAFGYCFHRHNQRNRVLWTVERAIAQRPANTSSLPSARPIGFAGVMEDAPAALDASFRVMSSVVLPRL